MLGAEPVRPELSGLELRRPRLPARLTWALVDLTYRWHPSTTHRQQRQEMRDLNHRLKETRKSNNAIAPLLTYREDTDLVPDRLQPMPRPNRRSGRGRDGHRNLKDLEAAERVRAPWVIGPIVPEIDLEYLVPRRALLPRRFRKRWHLAG